MDFQEYAEELNHFSFRFHNEDKKLFEIDIEVKERIILSRLYYALLHHFFQQHKALANSTASGKHETMLRMVQKEHSHHFPLFMELKKLREWADYRPMENMPFPVNVGRLLHNANRVIHAKA